MPQAKPQGQRLFLHVYSVKKGSGCCELLVERGDQIPGDVANEGSRVSTQKIKARDAAPGHLSSSLTFSMKLRWQQFCSKLGITINKILKIFSDAGREQIINAEDKICQLAHNPYPHSHRWHQCITCSIEVIPIPCLASGNVFKYGLAGSYLNRDNK